MTIDKEKNDNCKLYCNYQSVLQVFRNQCVGVGLLQRKALFTYLTRKNLKWRLKAQVGWLFA
jgi:hypothetical protein